MAMDMQRLVELGPVVDREDHALAPRKGLPWLRGQPGPSIDRPRHPLFEQGPQVKLLTPIDRPGHATLFAAFEGEGNGPRLVYVDGGRNRIGRQGEIVRQVERGS